MVDYDSALPVRGNVQDADSVYAENTLLVTAGVSLDGKYRGMNVDSEGRQLVIGPVADGADTEGYPLLGGGLFETNGGSAVATGKNTSLALDAFGRTICVGQVADGSAIIANANPVLIAGQDGTNVQTLLTDTSGRLIVNVGGGTKAGTFFNNANLVKDSPTLIKTIAGPAVVKRVYASGSGLAKFEILVGVTSSEALEFVQFNSTANPNVVFEFTEDGLTIPTGSSIVVQGTNLENRASPASDFDGYATIVTEVGI